MCTVIRPFCLLLLVKPSVLGDVRETVDALVVLFFGVSHLGRGLVKSFVGTRTSGRRLSAAGGVFEVLRSLLLFALEDDFDRDLFGSAELCAAHSSVAEFES